ncbi:MAG: DNA methyltransferase [Ignavibacteria bacterium]|jgi:site-specific DNA-methyltransferase (adenine-specific)
MQLSENTIKLKEQTINQNISEINQYSVNVEFIILPFYNSLESIPDKIDLFKQLNDFIDRSHKESLTAILTSPIFAADFCAQLNNKTRLKLWIAVKLANPIGNKFSLKEHHAALLIISRDPGSLKHTKTRISYKYCIVCNKTIKDYGGKKHIFHEYGTLISDVWRDIAVDYEDLPMDLIDRLKDLFGLREYKFLNIYDQREYFRPLNKKRQFSLAIHKENNYSENSKLYNGDCIEQLKRIPDNCIDFCFADPPYNLNKNYKNWDDGIDIKKYFTWCDDWLSELSRVLKPNRTLAVLNIPQWCIRHFKHLSTILDYQDWIVWEGLSMPVRMIMPAHYSILCFSKGKPRQLPGFMRNNNSSYEKKAIETLSENFCKRPNCIKKRQYLGIKDTETITNLWWDIHRLKHNSRRMDHPCQLPPLFMYRLITLFTNEREYVLDPFNGVGTTTLTAQQLNRKYIGIELSEYYHKIAIKRHEELRNGIDPFRKNNIDIPKAKNSPVARLKKQKYRVSKKVLQLEVKKIAKQLGKIPTKEEVAKFSKYPMAYYETYFISWGEVTAAARTTGMSERRKDVNKIYETIEPQLQLFKESRKKYKKSKFY